MQQGRQYSHKIVTRGTQTCCNIKDEVLKAVVVQQQKSDLKKFQTQWGHC